jgi:hypothetical protein
MKPRDKIYLALQFRVKIHSKNGTEFQGFFEDIMEKVYPNFQKIRPYGKSGDGGNDGYIKDLGIYYQVYSPNTPLEKDAKAAEKLLNDFENLKINWDNISKIREYHFVFNDKYGGSIQKIESALSELNKKNKDIKFSAFLAKDLESLFLKSTGSRLSKSWI